MKKGLYTEEDIAVMCLSYKSRNASRLKELVSFIKLSGFRKIGIAACFSVRGLAENFAEKLRGENIKAIVVDCKESGLSAAELSADMCGVSCDPKAQAQYLNEEKTDFNVNFGLCLGHGLLFQKYSQVPVTTMLVKDFSHKHNVAENFISRQRL